MVSYDKFMQVHEQALDAAKTAAKDYFNNTLGGVDQFPCGFSWVKVTGVRLNSKLGKSMALAGFRKSYSSGIELWNPAGYLCQNVDVAYAGSQAYAQVLYDNGIEAYAESRWD